jgi:hypothetical protein
MRYEINKMKYLVQYETSSYLCFISQHSLFLSSIFRFFFSPLLLNIYTLAWNIYYLKIKFWYIKINLIIIYKLKDNFGERG